jgi:hypothetical protein
MMGLTRLGFCEPRERMPVKRILARRRNFTDNLDHAGVSKPRDTIRPA